MPRKWSFPRVSVVKIGVVLLSLAAAVGLWRLFGPYLILGQNAPGPAVWPGYWGITELGAGQDVAKQYEVRSRQGNRIYGAPFVFWRGHLVYLSPDDKAFCVVSATGARRWIPVKGGALGNWELNGGITPTPRGVVLNVSRYIIPEHLRPGDAAVQQFRSFEIDLNNGLAAPITGALQAKGTADSGALAVLVSRHEIVLRSLGTQRVVVRSKRPILSWDYDFIGGVTAIVTRWSTILIAPDGRRQVLSIAGEGVSLWGKQKRVWVSIMDPLWAIFEFKYDGSAVGTLCTGFSYLPVQEATPSRLRLLDRLGIPTDHRS